MTGHVAVETKKVGDKQDKDKIRIK